MLTSIELSNFKSFSDQSLKLSPMTLLAGLNNSGKSSIIQAFRMLWKWAKMGDPTLPGHGSLKEMKNIKSAQSSSIKLSYLIDGKNNSESKMEIYFTDSGEPKINKFQNNFESLPIMNYISADRWGPRVSLPVYTSAGDLTHTGEHGEFVIDFLARHERDILPDNLIHNKAEGNTLEFNTRAWLEEISPNIDFKHHIDLKSDTSYAVIGNFRPTNTGFGLSYTLPIIVSLLGMSAEWRDNEKQKIKSENGTIILLENPEAHLHPKGQTSIGKLIALVAATGTQVIVETHSDHLMDGIRIAIKENSILSDKVSFHYFTLNKEGFTSIESPIINPDGKFNHWPKGFFDQTMKNRAILARR